MFSYVSLEDRVRADHPLRAIKVRTEVALKALNPVFSKMYAAGGRPSIAPERLLKAQLLIALFSVLIGPAILRAAGLQSAVSLVSGHADR